MVVELNKEERRKLNHHSKLLNHFILFTCLFGFTALGTDSRAFCTIGKSSTTDSTVPPVTGDTQLYLQLKC